jgi:hypothetical protein
MHFPKKAQKQHSNTFSSILFYYKFFLLKNSTNILFTKFKISYDTIQYDAIQLKFNAMQLNAIKCNKIG